ncbi:MAG: 3-hydroxyacyl-CoA dehydrogenase [Proteobacteria bacterium]|nr:3-hydroxyacyl-CoA dehydrogenase [Pseudomonadota bacterium]
MSGTLNLAGAPVVVVGAGIMGAGIAQVAAQAGHRVFLHDARAGAAASAHAKLGETFTTLVAKGKLTADEAAATLARITPINQLEEAASARLAIEAIVEQVEPKRALFVQLQTLLGPDAVIATNTSSISVTALAQGLPAPERLVGMHFFNPVALMKLVEVVSGLRTAPEVAQAVFERAAAWGKTPVHAASTPGFIVNRIARPYYAETLALLLERAAPPEVLDACLRAAGFRMGPCELTDLIGHDTNFAVTRSVYEAFFYDARFVPSPVQRDLVDGGLLGRKTGRGFYCYPEGAPALPPAPEAALVAGEVIVHGSGPIADALAAAATAALAPQGWGPARDQTSDWIGLRIDGARLQLTDGRPARTVAQQLGTPDVAVFDRPFVLKDGSALAYAVAPGANPDWQLRAGAWLTRLGHHPLRMEDAPGLVAARTIAMLINEAADAVQQGVCDEAGADAAMKLGVNYPAGPFEWLAGWSVAGVLAVLHELDACYGGARYRASPWLQRRA